MKNKRLLFIFVILAVFFYSCDSSGGEDGPGRTFWAQDIKDGHYYQVRAELLAENEYCNVWAEKGSGVSEGLAFEIADTYRRIIYPKMISAFAFSADIVNSGQTEARNAMELADWMGDGDGKLCILLLDIKDNYKEGVNDSFVGGYFSMLDLFSRKDFSYSNECDMIYIDVHPQTPGSVSSYMTLAHEMQHMMNFAVSYLERNNGDSLYQMDVWIDEGLSSAAEWLVYEVHPEVRWKWFNEDISGLIQKGNNFFVWGNREDENQYAVLDDYATVYLFFQWLRLQSGGNKIYSDIISSSHYDHWAVTSAAGYSDWGTLLKTWLAANYINASSGRYGYMDDPDLRKVQAKTAPGGITSLNLYPGEGVYSIAGVSPVLPSNGTYIRYAGLSKTPGQVNDSGINQGDACLTYNINTDYEGAAESGTTTGIAAAVTMASGFPRKADSFYGPFKIGAADALRQNGRGESFFPDLTKISGRMASHE